MDRRGGDGEAGGEIIDSELGKVLKLREGFKIL